MRDPTIKALKAKLEAGEIQPQRRVLWHWVRKNYEAVGSLLEEGVPWRTIVDTMNAQGIRNDRGHAVTVKRAREAWYAVKKEMGGAGRAQPRPRFDPPAVPISPRPSRNAKPDEGGAQSALERLKAGMLHRSGRGEE